MKTYELYRLGEDFVREFMISIQSFQDVQEFVSIATVQPFRIVVGNSRYLVNAKSFMGMFSLDYSEPLQVRMRCTQEEFDHFREAADRFVVK